MENNIAKHTVLQLGSLITLYLSVSFLVTLLFSVINLIYPDSAENYYQIEDASSSVRLAIAILVVFFPTYLLLTRLVNKQRRSETNAGQLWLTKWLIYLSLLVGGGVLLGDVVAVILGFLEGDLTTRFLLKALVLLVVVGAAFYYYLEDARGFWLKHENESKLFAVIMSLVVLASLITGFFHTETPSVVREMRLDEAQMRDLQQIQFQIEESIRINGTSTLPANLEEAYGDLDWPQAPENRDSYTYEVTDRGFKLCATFSRDSASYNMVMNQSFDSANPIKNADNWQYKEGRYCFDRVVM